MKLLIALAAVVALLVWHASAQAGNAEPKKVDWKDFSNFEEERLFQIIEGEEYDETDKEHAVAMLPWVLPKPGLSTIRKLLAFPLHRDPSVTHRIVQFTPIMLEFIAGPISRRESVQIFREYCYGLLKTDNKSLSRDLIVRSLVKIGDFVPAVDFGVPPDCEKWSLTIEECCDKIVIWKGKVDKTEFNESAKLEYGIFLSVLTYSAAGLDWRPKLAPGAEAQSKIDENIKLLSGDDPEKRKAAREALLKTGIPAYPAIEKAQKDPDTEVHASCDSLIIQYPFTIPKRAEGFVEKFHLDRDVLFLAALLDIKDEQLHKGAYERLIKITGAKLPQEREKWKEWHAANAPYAEWDEKEGKWNVVQSAKESQIPLSRWNLIPEEQRKNWSKLDEKVRTQLKEESEKQYQELLDKEEEDRKKSWPPEPTPEEQTPEGKDANGGAE